MHKSVGYAVASLLLLCPAISRAQLDYNQEDEKRIRSAEVVGTLGADLFGESTNFYTGATGFRHVDLSIPGNNALAVEVARSVDISNPGVKHNPLGRAFGDWDLELPYIGGTFLEAVGWKVSTATPEARCSSPTGQLDLAPPAHNSFEPQRYWQGYDVVIPGRGAQSLMRKFADDPHTPTTGGPWRWVTRDLTQFGCVPLSLAGGTGAGYGGEGFLAVTPDGHRYFFDQMVVTPALAIRRRQAGQDQMIESRIITEPRKEIRLYASRVEDAFGNFVTFNRTGGRLTSITSSDGRSLVLTYDAAGRITTASDGTRTVTYNYLASGHLGSVVRPDGSQWGFQLANVTPQHVSTAPLDPLYGNWDPASPECGWKRRLADDERTGTVTHPSGATGAFTFRYQRHVRASVPASHCSYDTLLTPTGMPTAIGEGADEDWKFQSWTPRTFDVLALRRKQITGPGIDALAWEYAYGAGPVVSADYGPHTRHVTGTRPDGSVLKLTFGNRYMIDDGQLLSEEVIQEGQVLRRRDLTYVTDVTGQPFRDRIGMDSRWNGDVLTSERNRPLLVAATTQQGVVFTAATESFDAKARPVTMRRHSSLGDSRRDTTTYHDHTGKWILGQVAQTANVESQKVLSRTEFDAGSAMPVRYYGPGDPTGAATPRLLQAVTYRADGTVATLKDGRGNVTALNHWFRGVPRTIAFADATTRSATVDAIGQVTSVTDQNGFTTTFAYDAGGRLARRSWPTGDEVAWAPTVISHTRVATAEYGLGAGHWRQVVSTGNGRTETYFDALMRPRLVREYDAGPGAAAATSRFMVKAFDHDGRETFRAYPVAVLSELAEASDGVRTAYDALGRVTSVTQDDGDDPSLVTRTQYLAGFRTRVVNPRQHATVTDYAAWDAPDLSMPKKIQVFDGGQPSVPLATTDLSRDVLGQTTRVRRSGTWDGATLGFNRDYRYDRHLRLERSWSPEERATYFDYDDAGNLAATYRCVSAVDATCGWSSSGARPPLHARRTYDALNRVATTTFADGVDDAAYDYTPDGLLASLTSGESAWTYEYNRRRLPTRENLHFHSDYTIDHHYDANGHLRADHYAGLQVDYAPNALGQATKAGSWASGVVYHPDGAIRQFTYGNGVVHTLGQNARGLPATSRDLLGAGEIVDYAVAYDANGNVRTSSNDIAGAYGFDRTMSYDALDRLSGVTGAGGQWTVAGYTYDPLDNLRTSTLVRPSGTESHAYEYDANNRLVSVARAGLAPWNYGYDARGNVTADGRQNYLWTAADRLARVRNAGSAADEEWYRYDGHGRRSVVWRHDGTGSVPVYGSDGRLWMTADNRLGGVNVHVYLGDDVIADVFTRWSTGQQTTEYIHVDPLGSPVARTDGSGSVVPGSRIDYAPYGRMVPAMTADATSNDINYTGHSYDTATGLVYMQQRYYDPATSRFLTPDPEKTGLTDGSRFRRYVYAANNPYLYVDPDGRAELTHWPVPGHYTLNEKDKPREGRGEFGAPRDTRGGSTHSGIDIKAPVGTPVVAAADGVVVGIRPNPSASYGNQVVIDHGDELFTQSAHLDTSTVSTGDAVTGGQVIGTVGTTGNTPSEGDPHLHFEVRTGSSSPRSAGGKVVDPLPVLPAKPSKNDTDLNEGR